MLERLAHQPDLPLVGLLGGMIEYLRLPLKPGEGIDV
jgi:hypothetical protein